MLNICSKIKIHAQSSGLFGFVLLSSLLRVKSYLHCNVTKNSYLAMEIKVLPALADNYMYLLIDKATREAAVVDPFDAKLVAEVVKTAEVNLTTILTTHHHSDHAGGNHELVQLMEDKNLTVVGGDNRINAINKIVNDSEEFNIGKLRIKCIHTPCHTTGHMCYYVIAPEDDKAVFTGDTLFMSGCGRFFEGTAEQMYDALINKLGSLPNHTKVYCGHEYTESNLKFATFIEPNNTKVQEMLFAVQNSRKKKHPTVPSIMGHEKLTNPFMRVHDPYLQKYAGTNDPVATMDYLRKQKDIFTP